MKSFFQRLGLMLLMVAALCGFIVALDRFGKYLIWPSLAVCMLAPLWIAAGALLSLLKMKGKD